MIKQNELVPKRRFEGFTNEWEERNFEQEVELYSGLTYSPTEVRKKGTFVLRSSNVQHGEIVNADNVYVNSEVVNSSNVRKGDIIVVVRNGSRSLIGKHAQIKEEMNETVIGAFMTGIRSNKTNFINALLDTPNFKGEIDKNLGATINQITNSMFKNMSFFLPSAEEQQKIGNFFKHLDDMIALQQRKIDKTKALKSAYLAEMFPAEGEHVPKRRYEGFVDDWKIYQFENIIDMYNNLRIPVTASDRIPGNTPYYGANGIQDYVQGSTHEGEFVLIAEDGANDLTNYPVQYVNGKAWVNNHAHIVSGKENIIDNLFLVSRMKSMNISKWLVGGGRAKLNAEVLKIIQIKIPSFQEQEQIGLLFKHLDEMIATHQQKLEKLKATKQAYLHEMFV